MYPVVCDAETSVCRDYLRNVCKRGRKCRFKHPLPDECEKLRRLERTFCHDYQNSTCRRPACKFLHYTREEEEVFRRTGYLNPTPCSTPSISKLEERAPICKDFTNGVCSRGSNCKYRHINKDATGHSFYHQVNSWDDCGPTTTHLPTNCDSSLPTFSQIPSSYHLSASETFSFVNTTVQPNYATIVALPTSATTSQLSQTPVLTNPIVGAGHEPIIKPANDIYVTGDNSNSIVGVIDGATAGQPALFAYPSIVPGVNSASVLKVAPDSQQHTNILRHPSTIRASHTTYHLVPHDSNPHHHLLATSSHTPTVLTIPLPQFSCDVSHTTNLMHPQATVACTAQHPAVLTGVVAPNSSLTSPTAYYPSYNLHIDRSSTADGLGLELKSQKPIQGTGRTAATVTTAVSSPTAVLAAAAGYLAQHLPTIASTSISEGQHSTLTQSQPVDVHKSAVVAAANLPSVPAAAAAAVAAAAAFARSSSITQGPKHHSVATNSLMKPKIRCSTSGLTSDPVVAELKSISSLPSAPVSRMLTFSSLQPSLSTIIDKPHVNFETNSTHIGPCTENSVVDNNDTNCSVVTKPKPSNSSDCDTGSEYLNSQDEENAKTAAAMAAAACIGAIFSQPMAAAAAGNHNSSMVAMIDNLIGRSHDTKNGIQPPGSMRHAGLVTKKSHTTPDIVSNPSDQKLDKCTFNQTFEKMDLNQLTATTQHSDVNFCQIGTSCVTSTPTTITVSTNPNNGLYSDTNSICLISPSVSFPLTKSDDGSDNFSFSSYSDSKNWSSVTTTMASAAAAAAAVAATAAVTGSANFFRLTQLKNMVDSHVSCQNKRSLSATTPTCTTSACTSHCVEEPKKICMETDSVLSSSSEECELTGLPSKVAVTMTSAAAAAAMVAAAATVAAERHQLKNEYFYKMKHSSKRGKLNLLHSSDTSECLCDAQIGSKLGNFCVPSSETFHPSEHYTSKSISSLPHYEYHHHAVSTDCIDDFEDDEADVFEEDDSESTTLLSPETTPPYRLRIKDYTSQLEDARPIAYGLSPTESLCESSRKWSVTGLKPTKSPINANDRKMCHDSQRTYYQGSTQIKRSTSKIFPLRRTRSSNSLFDRLKIREILLSTRSKSCPGFNRVFEKKVKLKSPSDSIGVTCALPLDTLDSSRFSKKKLLSNKVPTRLSSQKHKLLRHRTSLNVRHKVRFVDRNLHSTQLGIKKRQKFLISNKEGAITTISPNLLLSDEYNVRDDTDFVDYDDEDLYEMNIPRQSVKRSVQQMSSQKNANFHSNTITSMKQQHALRAENIRLRRKLSDLMRQRGDLRAANEMLLEQNARLRQSSKRVSAVARMAESATKIIEAHNKSHFVQSPTFPASNPIVSQPHVPFSIAQAAAAVVAAAAQNQTNTHAHNGVYVSSPTASTTQQTPQVVATSHLHPIFPQLASTTQLSNGIALPSHQPIATVQIQAQPVTLPSPVASQSATVATHLLQPHPSSIDLRQSGLSSYYQHPINPALETLTASQTVQNISPASSAIQVCHYPVAPIGNVFPKLSQDTSESPKIVSVGGPNTVTLLFGQTTQPTTAYAIPASMTSHSTVPLQIPVTLETRITATGNVPSDSHIPYSCQGTNKMVFSVAYPHHGNSSCIPTTSVHFSVPESVQITTSHPSALGNQIQFLRGQ